MKKYKIGEIAELTGLTTRTIRYYEEIGLMGSVERETGGTRYFDENDIQHLKKINTLKKIGLSLEEINDVIDLYFIDGKHLEGKRKVLKILKEHLASTEEKIDALNHFRTEIISNLQLLEDLIKQYENI